MKRLYSTGNWVNNILFILIYNTKKGGINVMSYDVSNNMKYHECPEDKEENCPLHK